MELRKAPSVAETIDWAHTLLALGADELTPERSRDTLGVILKHQDDMVKAGGSGLEYLDKSVMLSRDRLTEFVQALRAKGIQGRAGRDGRCRRRLDGARARRSRAHP